MCFDNFLLTFAHFGDIFGHHQNHFVALDAIDIPNAEPVLSVIKIETTLRLHLFTDF